MLPAKKGYSSPLACEDVEKKDGSLSNKVGKP